MAKFNIHDWRFKHITEQGYKDKLSDQILNQLFEELIPQDILLNEGIGDFLSGLKDKIKNTKAFTSLIALASEFKDAAKAVTLAIRLKSLGILPKNEAEVQILKNKLEGKKINEAPDSTYGKKLNSKLSKGNEGEYKKLWKDTFVGKATTTIFALFMITNIVGSDVVDVGERLGIDFGNTTSQAGVTPSGTNMAGIANALTLDGFDQERIQDILTGEDDVTIKNVYSHGGDVKIAIDDEGKSTVETPDDIEDEGELSSETDNISKAADQGLKLNISGEQTANFILFDYGSSNLTQAGESEADTENDKIIDYLINGQDYSETIIGQSSNTGPNSNYDNSTNEADKLDANRANALADYSLDDIKRGLDDKGVKYTSTGTTITLEDGTIYTQNVEAGQNPEGLQKIEKTDNTPTQSAIRVGDVETTTPPTNVVLVDFDPVAAPGTTGGGTFVPPPIEVFGKLIREGQITAIMALINPNIKIFPYLNTIKHGKDDNAPLGGYTQSDWVKVRDNEDFPQESRNLAGVIINARKSPDSLTSKIADCLGIELSKRAKSRQLRPGSAGEPQFVRVTETIHPLYELLSEAAIDEFIDCSNVKKHGGQLLAYIGSMYASSVNPQQLGIVPDDLPSGLKPQMDKLGFEPSNVGIDKGIYVFLDAGEKLPVSKGAPISKGVPDKISEPVSLDIDSKAVEKGKIFTTPKEVPVFPKDFYKSNFYKDAVKDGWMFVNRKDLPYLPKGTKVKTIKSIEKLTNADYNKVKNTLEESKNMKNQKLHKVKNQISKMVKLQEAKNQISRMINEAIAPGSDDLPPSKPMKKAKADVQRVMRIVDRYIGEKVEWAELARAILQFDIPAKKAAINMAFGDMPTIRSIIMKEFGDEEDKTQSTDWGIKGDNGELGADETPADEFEDEII